MKNLPTPALLPACCFFLSLLSLGSCQEKSVKRFFEIRNALSLERRQETISIPLVEVDELVAQAGAANILLKEVGQPDYLLTQLVDMDGDGRMDELLFQTSIGPQEEKQFVLLGQQGVNHQRKKAEDRTFSRFVPERIDDYAWENDRVAFRTYGPEAQRRTEEGEKGGTLSSGIDCWLKRVSYPIINKWYKAHQQDPGAYHRDTGEGYDPYHVGSSRGCGGTGVWEQDSLYVSKNFVSWKTIATGPIRTIFELKYAPWEANGQWVRETKRISLDLGSNLSFYEASLESEQPATQFAIGLSLHEGKGRIKTAEERGWYRYWEPTEGSELGVAIVLDPRQVEQYRVHKGSGPDQHHLLVLTKPGQEQLGYYAGFGWKKSGQFDSVEEWDQYLEDFALRLASPLKPRFH